MNQPTAIEQRPVLHAPGAARLPVVVAGSLIGFFTQSLMAYLGPLYFPAQGLPKDAWETWGFYGVLAWVLGSPLAGALGNHLGERSTWALGLVTYIAGVAIVLFLHGMGTLAMAGLSLAAALIGIAGALIWVGSISMTQAVPAERRGLANSLMLASMGLGATLAPVVGSLLVRLSGHLWGTGEGRPFYLPFFVLTGLSAACAVLLWGWGQYPRGKDDAAPGGGISWLAALSIARTPVFLWIILPLSLFSSMLFQATNIYLPYRAGEGHIGLIQGSADHGWALLTTLGYAAQLVGGLLVGLLAGKRISIRIAGLILAAFAACSLGIGFSPSALSLFAAVALFEMTRQFVRWLQTGYVSELVPEGVRPTAIGLSVMLSGVGGVLFTFIMRRLQSPNAPTFQSWLPVLIAAGIGLLGTVWLLVVKKPAAE